MIQTLGKVVPSAMPGDADVGASHQLSRDEQLRLMQEALAHPDCGRVGTASIAELRARG